MSTYYVATTGNNGDPGTEAQPWLTLTYAESQLSANDILIARGGTYNETFYIDVSNVTIQNYPSETPIIDGGGTLPGGTRNSSLVKISYTSGGVTFDGFEIKNSTARGLSLKETNNNIIKNCVIHDIDEAGIVVDTNAHNTLLEDCTIHEHNFYWHEHGGIWGAGILAVRSHDITIRRCKVYNGYGEGIIAGRGSSNVIIEYCIVYDNRALQIYADTSKDLIIRYNLAYGTRNETYNTRYSGFTAGDGIAIAVELPNPPYGDGAKIYGNLVADCYRGLTVWDITNTEVYNNTFVEAYVTGGTRKLLYIDYRLTDHIVRNNIFVQTTGTIADVPSSGTYTNNLWSKTPEADAQGEGDVIGDPILAKTSGWNSLTSGAVDGSEFVLQDSSPAINVGSNLGGLFHWGLDPASTWPDNVDLLSQDDYGIWEIGGFIYVTGGGGGTFPDGWNRKCVLSIQANKIDANQVNFPVLLTEDTLPPEMFDADGSYPALNGGGDIRFSSDSAGSTRLSCEIVTFITDNNPANGIAEIWVKVPSISSSSNTTIYVWYNKSGESQPASDAAYGSESVWDSNFKMVQHLNDATASTILDSTSNDNDGTKGVASNPNEVAGQIGKAQNFDGNDYITVPHASSIDFADEDFTISLWFKTDTVIDQNYFFSKNYGSSGIKWYGANLNVGSGTIRGYVDDGTTISAVVTTDDFNDNAWHQLVIQRNVSTNKVIAYIDGNWDAEVVDAVGSIANTGNLIIGCRADLNVDRFFYDLMDEFHISAGLRSATWIKTEYNNQNDPATFVIEGTPEGEIEAISHLMIMGM